MEQAPGARIKSYVLRSGRISRAQERSYAAGDSPWRVPPGQGPLDFRAVFGREAPVIAEIGFGAGDATAAFARAHPGLNCLGIEVFKAGIGSLLLAIEREGLTNIRIIEGDAALVFAGLIPGASLAGIHLFFPDPWPKKRHHKRRLIRRPFTDTLACKLQEGAYVSVVTDWAGYAEFACAELGRTPGLVNVYPAFAPRQLWRPETSFERKGLAAGRLIYELLFQRRGGLSRLGPADIG